MNATNMMHDTERTISSFFPGHRKVGLIAFKSRLSCQCTSDLVY